MKTASVSIILCTHQRCEGLRKTLRSLSGVQVPESESVELLVLENGESDGTEDVVKSCDIPGIEIRYHHLETKSKSRALNEGIKQSQGDVIVFIDDDLGFPREWLQEMVRPIREMGYSAVAGGIVIPEDLKRSWMLDYHLPWLGSTIYLSRESPSEVAGANFAVHKRVFDKVAEFDEKLGGGGLGNCEDSRFGRDLCQAGFQIYPQFDCCVEHHFQPEKLLYKNWVRAAESAGRSRAYLEGIIEGRTQRWPTVRSLWLAAKLRIRKSISRKYAPTDEGIPAWELSYRCDHAMFKNHARIQRQGST